MTFVANDTLSIQNLINIALPWTFDFVDQLREQNP